MTIPTAAEILHQLQRAEPRPTSEAPRDCRGIYGLIDHLGDFRYIGSTSAENETFYKRIHQRHRTGSETSSHYFSRMYNTGRMWRLRNDLATKVDGDIAKSLRNAFIALHCRAVWVPLSDHADIAGLEAEVISLAPPEMIAWNRRGMEAYDEPASLVDALINSLSLSPFERAALGRQLDRSCGTKTVAITVGAVPALPQGPFRFFALDVETANHDRASICQVGVACVRPDNSIETWVTLVDPQTTRWVFSGLHGINADMVQGAPTIGSVIDTLDTLLAGRTVYQHSGFDRSAVRAACDTLGRTEPSWDWQNSVSVARTTWPELKGNGGHGLASLKSHLGLRFEHHDAGEDARAAAELVLLAEKGAVSMVNDFEVLDDDDNGVIETGAVPSARSVPSRGTVGSSVLTQGNLNNHHFYLREFMSAFPEEVIGGGNRTSAASRTISVSWGEEIPISTDIDGSKKIFRNRAWVRTFFERNAARPGDTVEVIESAPYCYQVILVRA
jgi:DNA polymerase III epsilon subunit-like protein